jgi:lysophospholipase L1-like esterase
VKMLALPSLLALGGMLVLQGGLRAQQAPNPPNPAFAEIKDDPSLPRVLLIGDSISIGYTLPTRALLQGKANVHRIPVNGGPTTDGLANLDAWLGTGKWQVIHFNWGLHDLKFMGDGLHQIAIDQYESNLRQLVGWLKRTGAVLIWASTTPVPDAKTDPARQNSDVIAYNVIAARVMQENGVPINDLYAVVFPRLSEIQRPANVHYTDPGYEILAERVAGSIRAALGAHQ